MLYLTPDCWVKILSHLDYTEYTKLQQIKQFKSMLTKDFENKLIVQKYGISSSLFVLPSLETLEEALKGKEINYRYMCRKYNINLDRFRN